MKAIITNIELTPDDYRTVTYNILDDEDNILETSLIQRFEKSASPAEIQEGLKSNVANYRAQNDPALFDNLVGQEISL